MSEQRDNLAFEPRVVGFFCNWCSYRAADLAGIGRMSHAPNLHIVRLMCSGRLDPSFVLKALSLGADGVMVAGCHPGECHYIEQNHKAMRRVAMIQHLLKNLGIDPRRVRLMWASAAEGPQLAAGIDDFVGELRRLGPLAWPGRKVVHKLDAEAFARLEAEHNAQLNLGELEVAP